MTKDDYMEIARILEKALKPVMRQMVEDSVERSIRASKCRKCGTRDDVEYIGPLCSSCWDAVKAV